MTTGTSLGPDEACLITDHQSIINQPQTHKAYMVYHIYIIKFVIKY